MTICEFCLHLTDNKCELGLNLPRKMGCRSFEPGIEKFCSTPDEFVSSSQIIQMASFFGMKGTELKKVKMMAAQEEKNRLESRP